MHPPRSRPRRSTQVSAPLPVVMGECFSSTSQTDLGGHVLGHLCRRAPFRKELGCRNACTWGCVNQLSGSFHSLVTLEVGLGKGRWSLDWAFMESPALQKGPCCLSVRLSHRWGSHLSHLPLCSSASQFNRICKVPETSDMNDVLCCTAPLMCTLCYL